MNNVFKLAVLSFLVLSMAGNVEAKTKTGKLTGKLTVTAPARPVPTPAGSANESNYVKAHSTQTVPFDALPEQVVIYLEKVPGKYKVPTQHVQLDQKFLKFTTRVLPVLKGTTVDFTNDDPVYHNVFTNSQINKFDLGRKGYGETASVKMSEVEIPVKVYCELHPRMKAYILVLPNPFFTTVSPGQNYEITGIPPGTYKMTTWHDLWAPVEQTVKIKKGKTTLADITIDKAQE